MRNDAIRSLLWLATSLPTLSALGLPEIRGAQFGGGAGRSEAQDLALSYCIGTTVVGQSQASTLLLRSGLWGASPHATGTEADPVSTLPTRDALMPSSPNPFNPRTLVRYELAGETQLVRLIVYDLRGRIVRTLLDATQPAGRYELVWDGRDDRGATLASGVYLLRLQGARAVQTQKLTLVQ